MDGTRTRDMAVATTPKRDNMIGAGPQSCIDRSCTDQRYRSAIERDAEVVIGTAL
jgi:hypothetical protein